MAANRRDRFGGHHSSSMYLLYVLEGHTSYQWEMLFFAIDAIAMSAPNLQHIMLNSGVVVVVVVGACVTWVMLLSELISNCQNV